MQVKETLSCLSSRAARNGTAIAAASLVGVLLTCAVVLPLHAEEVDIAKQPYVPQHVTVPADKPYVVGPDTVFVAGNDVLIPLFNKLDVAWAAVEPRVKFQKIMMGSTLSVEGLTSEKSAFGPIGRGNRRPEVDQFVQRFGYEPTYLKIGYDSNPHNKLSTGIWVNASNPIKQITLEQAAAIFTTGGKGGDITHWSQLGVQEDWGPVPIHPYVARDTDAILAMIDEMRDKFGGRPFTNRVEWMPTEESAIDSVAQDAFGVVLMDYWNNEAPMTGVLTWKRLRDLGPKIKFVPMVIDDKGTLSDGTVKGPLHPMASAIGININRVPGKPLEPWLKAYCEFLLSKDAQDIIGSSEMREAGFRPLQPGEAAEELKKIE
ncbi:PstS family phosphate ABC transporter substrate-binding protein [Paraburkholderia youngii]|uniref:PstS family phosphate ABC transporter substrate-binding protein n=1 Tax=Paraburkholderia youngii TaxID=2782701 RepID=UPI003D2564AA